MWLVLELNVSIVELFVRSGCDLPQASCDDVDAQFGGAVQGLCADAAQLALGQLSWLVFIVSYLDRNAALKI